jgi:tRNA pseudouridine55 synthase
MESKNPSGIVVVDKPADISSAGVVSDIKKIFRVKKAGHAGTLDPFATGVLVCCINRATKIAGFLLGGNKKYHATLCLGVETDTQDSTGTIIAENGGITFTEGEVKNALRHFEGSLEQLPPVYSALKHKGTPLYKLARAGNPVQKPARRVFIAYIKPLEIAIPEVRFEISCSAGTYVRTLCADIGKFLGCGGHLKALRRVESSGFSIENALSLSVLREEAKLSEPRGKQLEHVITMNDSLMYLPEFKADNSLTEKIRYGGVLTKKDINHSEGLIKIVDDSRTLIAVVETVGERDRLKYRCVLI